MRSSHYKSQNGQDKIALKILRKKIGNQKGFFLEMGAGNGVYLSNTYYFEKVLGWNGLLIEPNPDFLEELKANRKCLISTALCSDVPGKTVNFRIAGECSGIVDKSSGYWVRENEGNNEIQLKTKSLTGELIINNTPEIIDFFSLDVEGHEYEILRTFRFDLYKFRLICVEHNDVYDPELRQKEKIYDLLTSNGYERILEANIDDFYLNTTL